MLAVVSDSQRPMLITFLIGAAGFVLLPLVQELDPRQPQWNYPAVFRAAWRNTVHLALAVCLSISVFVLLWIAGMMFRMIGINTVLDVLGHARFHIAAWPIVLAVSLVGVRRRPQIADTLRRSWLTLNACCCRWWRWWGWRSPSRWRRAWRSASRPSSCRPARSSPSARCGSS